MTSGPVLSSLVRDDLAEVAHQAGARAAPPQDLLCKVLQVVEAVAPVLPLPDVGALAHQEIVVAKPEPSTTGGPGSQSL